MLARLSLAGALCLGITATSEGGVATFDDLPSLPVVTGATALSIANNGSSLYQGVTWDANVYVVGDQYRVDTATPGPTFGLPHSGHYFITNGTAGNLAISLTTGQVLTGAWFGQNAYYGFGDGANAVTIKALSGSTVLASIDFNLPAPSVAGQPGQMGFADTGSFASLIGITGYEIDSHAANAAAANWVADSFTFAPAASVPEPGSLSLLCAGALGIGLMIGRGRPKSDA